VTAPRPSPSSIPAIVMRITDSASNARVEWHDGHSHSFDHRSAGNWLTAIARLSDAKLALLLGTALTLLSAWPLALTPVPPLQDLPNHLASITVIQHPERYPEFAFNGYLKTNSALFVWLILASKLMSSALAAKLFVLGVLAVNGFILPNFVLALTGSRKRMIVASLLAWPLLHNWFVSTGMLNFALAVPLSLALMMMLVRHERAPSLRSAASAFGLAAVTWYAHVFPLLVVHLLIAVESIQRPNHAQRLRSALRMTLPILPISLLCLVSTFDQLHDSHNGMGSGNTFVRYSYAWELIYHAWSEYFGAFSHFEITSAVPALVLAACGFLGRRERLALLSPAAFAILGALYIFQPYTATEWFHVNSRIIPFLWIACLVRVPERLPNALSIGLAVSAIAYSAGLGFDYMRVERARQEWISGIDAVPEGSRLLPLVFKHKEPNANTRPLMHAWGYYVAAKHTAAPLLFAHSNSFPVMYTEAPPRRFNHLVLEPFVPHMAYKDRFCRAFGAQDRVPNDCDAEYRKAWREFWEAATPRYDHLVVWDVTLDALANIPRSYRKVFQRGRLSIFERTGTQPTQPGQLIQLASRAP